MRLTFLSASTKLSPRDVALVHSLKEAGHDVSTSRWDGKDGSQVRVQPIGDRGRPRRLARQQPEIILPATSKMVAIADRGAGLTNSWVARRPDWPAPVRDLIGAVPDDPSLSTPVGFAAAQRAPWDEYHGATPGDRHKGHHIILCYRSTPASPGHYLRAAFERAGVSVLSTDRIDFDQLGREGTDFDAVVIVESPTPPIELSGDNPGIPVVYWVHHGEHHLEGNLRLADRYGADLVLLAHSWHLAFRFDRAVERFPFAVDPSPDRDRADFDSRGWDLAFVGSIEGSAYARRRQLIHDAQTGLARVRVESDVTPAEMNLIYGDSRAVLNDGGRRHLPITMRVFEAVGAGALLVSEPAPGLDLLLGDSFWPIGPNGIDVGALGMALVDGTAEARASEATGLTLDAHTYDHRVDLLMAFLRGLEHHRDRSPTPLSPVDRFLYDHPYGQRILDGAGIVTDLSREIWTGDSIEQEPALRSFDTVTIGASTPRSWAKAARRFVVGNGLDPDVLGLAPRSVRTQEDLTIIDVGGPGYDLETVGGLP